MVTGTGLPANLYLNLQIQV